MGNQNHVLGVASTGFIILLCLLSCNSNRNLRFESLAKVIEMQKEPCFGDCPVFTLTIYENGLAKYVGEQGVQKMGIHLKALGTNEFRSIVKAFRDSDFFNFQSVYRSQVPDLPTVTISFTDGGTTKTVIGKENARPEGILELEARLDKIANADGWKAQHKENTYSTRFPMGTIPNQIIVRLIQGVEAVDWIKKYTAQEGALIESLSPSGVYWLISFNSEKIQPENMLESVREDEEVIGAEFNSEVNLRQ